MSLKAVSLVAIAADNRIVNPAMDFDQRYEGASTSISTGGQDWAADRWKAAFTGDATGVAVRRVVDGPAGFFANSIKCTIGTGSVTLAVGNQLRFRQIIEGAAMADLGFGAASAQALALSFWVKSSVAGTFSVSVSNNANNRLYATTYAIAAGEVNTWVRRTLAIPGDVTGTWVTTVGGTGAVVHFWMSAGTSNQTSTLNAWQAVANAAASTQTNLGATTGATFQITGVKLEPGSVVTPFVARPYGVEMLLCQRFYAKTFPAGTAPAQSGGVAGALTVASPVTTSGANGLYWPFPASMAASPTITTYNPSAANANWRNITAGADVAVSVDPASTKSQDGIHIATGGAVGTAADKIAIHAVADAGV
jgi:hypothetical protein